MQKEAGEPDKNSAEQKELQNKWSLNCTLHDEMLFV